MTPPFATSAIARAFVAFPDGARPGLLALRDLIFDVAAAEGIVGMEEVLRWGQPSYIAPQGTALRLGVPNTGGFAIYAHCASTVISSFAATFPDLDRIEGNRAVHFHRANQIDPARHGFLIRHALTYKR